MVITGMSSAAVPQPANVVSQVPVSWTPNVSGTTNVDGTRAPAQRQPGRHHGCHGGRLGGYRVQGQGDGQSRPRLAIISTGTTLGGTSAVTDLTAPVLNNNCSAEHYYVRARAFASDGSFLAVADTGDQNDGSMAYAAWHPQTTRGSTQLSLKPCDRGSEQAWRLPTV
jgi:hypothetical protein